jgi:hypothetical protein
MTLGDVAYWNKLEQMQKRDMSCLGKDENIAPDWLHTVVIVILIVLVAYLIGRDALPHLKAKVA